MAEEGKKENKNRRIIMIGSSALVGVVGIIAGVAYGVVASRTVYIDQSVVEAPIINLSPAVSGELLAVFVSAGDMVTANQPIARVGNEIVNAETRGEIITVNKNIGEFENAMTGQAVVATMIDPTQLRVVGHLDENKGLSNVRVGDVAMFTVDAFGSRQYQGVVDEVAPAAKQGSVAFDISSERPTNQFDVYVRFDPVKYPELKKDMSARVWVYTK